jgi:hypothetical protein
MGFRLVLLVSGRLLIVVIICILRGRGFIGLKIFSRMVIVGWGLNRGIEILEGG